MLTKNEINTRLSENRLAIALIGMSGMGKTYWAQKLAREDGFLHYNCDDEIAARIAEVLPSVDVGGLAAWMGQPYSDGYRERELKYLELEEDITRDGLACCHAGLDSASRNKNKKNVVIDTTGSVIYLSIVTLNALKQHALIVYLQANQAMKDALFENYLRDPKPVVWRGCFNKQGDETDHAALARCYPELLEYRSKRYQALADVTLSYEIAKNFALSGGEFFENISKVP